MTKSVRLRRSGRFTRGQCGPGEVIVEQRVAGSFLEFSLSHPARSEGAVVHQRGRPRRSVTANQPAPCRCQGRSLRSRCGAKQSSLDGDLEGSVSACGEECKCVPDVASRLLVLWSVSAVGIATLRRQSRQLVVESFQFPSSL
jgi:hypothetical protein